VAALLWSLTTSVVAAQPRRITHAPPHLRDEILVRFKDTATTPDIASAHAHGGGRAAKIFRSVPKLALVTLPPGLSAKEAIARYRQHPDVVYAEPNYLVTADGVPNDPLFPQLWGLHNTGQAGGRADADLDAVEAWDVATGSATPVVVVIDSGIDYTHEDLAANMFSSAGDCDNDGVDDDGNGFADDCHGINAITDSGNPMDDNGHGTHVAGTIGAVGNNGLGVAGINWNVRVMACKFLGATGSGFVSDAVQCMDYVARMKDRGVNIVATNNSWGGAGFSQALYDAIDAHRQRGILFIAAAGNETGDNDVVPHYPSNYALPNVLAVAATTRSDAVSSFSNVGAHTVHLGAPGSDILSTTPGNTYQSFSGTSMATPHVTGVAALLKAHDPTLDWRAIKNLILAGGDTNAALSETITARRLNARGALSCADSTVLSRLRPVATSTVGNVGTPVDLAALHINCAAPNGAVTVTVEPGGASVVLQDGGAAPDQSAGDGIYSGRWTPTAPGTYTLTFPGGDAVTVAVLKEYAAVPATFEYRAITGTSLDFGDDSAAQVTSPFPIRFGGGSFDALFVGSNGYVSFDAPVLDFTNVGIPAPHLGTLVAPFWDDLYPVQGTNQNVFRQVTGTAPNRELVIEWRAVRFFGCRTDAGATVTFQVVFFEGRSDVLFNYADTIAGGACPSADRGGSATVGIQVSSNRGAQLSNNAPSVDSGTALLWTLADAAITVTPTSHAFGDVTVGTASDRVFTVHNTGSDTLIGTVAAAPPFSIASGESFTIAAGETHAATVRFSPTTPGGFAGSVEFSSNAGPVSRAVTGTGVAAATVTMKAIDATATEAGTTTASFRVTRIGNTASPLTVSYAVGGTATAGSDYVTLPGRVTIAAGATTATILVTPIDDAVMEGDETVVASLAAGPDYAVGSPSSATITLVSDEKVTITAVIPTATEAGAEPGAFRVARAGSTASPLTVFYAVSGNAKAGSDYTALPGNVTIPAGASTADIPVTPIHDGVAEGKETVVATLTPNPGYVVGTPKSATVTIISDEPVTIAAVTPTATEVGPSAGVLRVTRSGGTAAPLTVFYKVSGTATAGSDYLALPGSVTIAAGASTADIVVTPIDDTVMEQKETVTVTLLAGPGYIVKYPRIATVTIVSDEVVTIAAVASVAAEGGPSNAAFRVTRTGGTAASLTVAYTVAGTAAAGRDYATLSRSVTIPAGASTADIVVAPIADAIAERSETVAVTLAPRSSYVIGTPATATVTIVEQ
jgi:subtilisin family serine protease